MTGDWVSHMSISYAPKWRPWHRVDGMLTPKLDPEYCLLNPYLKKQKTTTSSIPNFSFTKGPQLLSPARVLTLRKEHLRTFCIVQDRRRWRLDQMSKSEASCCMWFSSDFLIMCAGFYISKYFSKHAFRCIIIVTKECNNNDTWHWFELELAFTNWVYGQDLLKQMGLLPISK